jgi:hypothetical protein
MSNYDLQKMVGIKPNTKMSTPNLMECKEEKKDSIKISASLFKGENKAKFRENYKIGHVIGTGNHSCRLFWRSPQMPAHQDKTDQSSEAHIQSRNPER